VETYKKEEVGKQIDDNEIIRYHEQKHKYNDEKCNGELVAELHLE